MYKKGKSLILLVLSALVMGSCDLTDKTTDCPPAINGHVIDIPTDFTASNVYSVYDQDDKKIAEICHEYIKGFSETNTATVIYYVDATGQRTKKRHRVQ